MIWDIVFGVVIVLVGLVGVLLTAVTLPGIWIMVGAALVVALFRPEMFSPWTLVAAVGIAVLGEVLEFLSSAAGAKAFGGSKSGAMGSLVGALVGLVVGTFAIPPPIVGSLVGAIAGAGIGAALAERGIARKSWGAAAKSGSGAAVGRAVSVVVKTALAAVVMLLLSVAAFWGRI